MSAINDYFSNNIVAFGFSDATINDYTDEELIAKFDPKDPKYHRETTKIKELKDIKYGDFICCPASNYGLYGIGIALSSPKIKPNIHLIGAAKEKTPEYSYIEVAWISTGDNYKNKYIPLENLKILEGEKTWFGGTSVYYKKEVPRFIYRYLLNEDLPPENQEINLSAKALNNTLLHSNKLQPSSNESGTKATDQDSKLDPKLNATRSPLSESTSNNKDTGEPDRDDEATQSSQSATPQGQSFESGEVNDGSQTTNNDTTLNDQNSKSNEEKDPSISELAKELNEKLLSEKNLVLTGAPGTGKTYLACEIIAKKLLNAKKVELVQFHPSYMAGPSY